MSNEKNEKIASRSQLLGLAGQLAQNMPADMSFEIAQEWAGDPTALQKYLAGLRDGTCPIAQIKTREFEVTIYPERTVEEWVKAGKYNIQHLALNTANFGKFLTIRKGATESYKAKVVAFCLGRRATSDKAKRIRSRLNLKPIGFEHAAAVGEQYPELQSELGLLINLDAVVVSVGPTGQTHLASYLSYLHGYPCGRSFQLGGRGGAKWEDTAWFLGLRE